MAKSTTSPDLDDTYQTSRSKTKEKDTTTRTIHLSGGGTLSFDLDDVNLLDLNQEDRTFLFTVIDTLDAYARAHGPAPTPPAP